MDPSTKRILIILGIVVVVVVALFILAVAYTPAGEGRTSGCTPDRREAWRERLLGTKPVGPGQLRGCTTSLGKFSVPQGQNCFLTIAKADARSRRLVIESAQTIRLFVHTDADGRKMRMKSDPKSDKPTEISIGKEGQLIEFHCLVGNPCQIVLR